MSDVETVPVGDLEELLDAEIPCGGCVHTTGEQATNCTNVAVLRAVGHECVVGRVKCLRCWQAMLTRNAEILAARGRLGCLRCGRSFFSIESFADYRPF